MNGNCQEGHVRSELSLDQCSADGVGYGQGSEAIPARRLVVHIIHALSAVGWHIHMSVDLSKKTYDKDSLFFKSGPPLQRYFFSISFNESDKVRIIDSPNETVLEAFKTVVQVSLYLPRMHIELSTSNHGQQGYKIRNGKKNNVGR